MSLDDQLRAALRRESEMREPPPIDVRSVVRGGRARRRRARVRRVAAAALVLVAVTAGVFGVVRASEESPQPAHKTAPGTVRDLPTGPPPTLPHCEHGTTIVGAGAPIRSACKPMTSHAGSTIAWDDTGVYRVVDGRLDRLTERTPSSWVPALSQDGRFVAWVTDEPTPSLLVYDARTGHRLADVRMPTADGWTPGIDGHGRAYFLVYARSDAEAPIWMYDIATRRLTRLTGLPGSAT
jgi:hypothetical protein